MAGIKLAIGMGLILIAISEMVAEAGSEDLRFGFQAAKGARVHYAVAIALKRIAVRMLRFRVAPSPALFHRKPEMAEHGAPRLLRDIAVGLDGGLSHRSHFGALGIEQFARFGRLGGAEHGGQHERGLVL